MGAANDPRAPWNEVPQDCVDIEVTCSNTLSKSATISVDDYKVDGLDEDGYPDYNYEDCDLKTQWSEQLFTAKEALDYAVKCAQEMSKLADIMSNTHPNIARKIKLAAHALKSACNGWDEDEFEVATDF